MSGQRWVPANQGDGPVPVDQTPHPSYRWTGEWCSAACPGTVHSFARPGRGPAAQVQAIVAGGSPERSQAWRRRRVPPSSNKPPAVMSTIPATTGMWVEVPV